MFYSNNRWNHGPIRILSIPVIILEIVYQHILHSVMWYNFNQLYMLYFCRYLFIIDYIYILYLILRFFIITDWNFVSKSFNFYFEVFDLLNYRHFFYWNRRRLKLLYIYICIELYLFIVFIYIFTKYCLIFIIFANEKIR